MVFSSPVFLFIFFPCFALIYALLPRVCRNSFILLGSIAFYVLGVGALTVVVLSMVMFNWIIAMVITKLNSKPNGGPIAKMTLAGSIVVDLCPLIFFKYLLFFTHVFTDVTGVPVKLNPAAIGTILPLGISFYTFHFISYLVDIYHRRVEPEKNLQKFGIYIFLFPHLIAGPVVRFAEIRSQLPVAKRTLVKKDIFWGLIIFIIGLSKKTLIADPLGAVVDSICHPGIPVTAYSAWLAAFCYSFQIYFDFSGYTDMAIGMARTMGFRFPRNFNRPYASVSVTEFWQRWHMTLSRWFRDYVYIPAGGNRGTAFSTYRNLFLVFVLCALWHGAAYTFLVWGVGHGALIALERAGLVNLKRLRLGNLPVFVLATLLWVPFRAPSMSVAWANWTAMFGLSKTAPLWIDPNRALADPKVIALLVIATVVCLVGDRVFRRVKSASFKHPRLIAVYCGVLYVLACMSAVERGFNPFIYFQF